MPERLRRVLAAVVTVAALAVIAWGVTAGDDGGGGDRVQALARRLRCPVCQGESIADSGAELSRDYRELIAEEVAAGKTDREIIDLFVARYGEWVLLDPPARGRTLVLWLLPAAALVVGAAVVATRKRPGPPPPADEAGSRGGDAAAPGEGAAA